MTFPRFLCSFPHPFLPSLPLFPPLSTPRCPFSLPLPLPLPPPLPLPLPLPLPPPLPQPLSLGQRLDPPSHDLPAECVSLCPARRLRTVLCLGSALG